MEYQNKLIVGREEWAELPGLGIPIIKAKVDSGARTSALHAFNIHTYKEGTHDMVRFDVHPIQNNRKIVRSCVASLIDHRVVKNSGGEIEKRFVIRTELKLGANIWDIEITLTNRDSMGYRMLLGREAMHGKLIVDPELTMAISDIEDNAIASVYQIQQSSVCALNIVLLATDASLYSNRRIIEAAMERGHNIQFLNARECYISIVDGVPALYAKGKRLDNIDAVIPRLRPSVRFYGCAIVRQFKAKGTFCLNDDIAISRSGDKLCASQLFANKSINMPTTGFANSPEDTKHLIKMIGGAPLVVKVLEGSQGMGVILAETNKVAENVTKAFKMLKANILVQEFIKEAHGRDIRCFVIDGKVVGAMERIASEGDFRANLHLGGTSSAVKLDKEEKRMAVAATDILGLKVAGVDILRSSTGPKVIEVNSSPGLEGIERVAQADIASMMVECIEKYVLGRNTLPAIN